MRMLSGRGKGVPRPSGTWWLHLFVCVVVCCRGTVLCQGADNQTVPEEFLEQCKNECAIYKNMMACGKYKALRWMSNVVKEKEFVYGPFKIIKIPSVQSGRFLPEVKRQKKSQIAETLYFIREAAEDLFTRRALVYTVEHPTGARGFNGGLMVLDDDELGSFRKSRTFEVNQGSFRIFKKKKNIILPILILLNLLKLKLLILPIFLGVHFIKKLLVLGSLLLPSILAHLKICKIGAQPYHHHHPWASEYQFDYPSGYGHEDAWDHRNDVAGSTYGGYYGNSHSLYNPFAYYFQNYYANSKQGQR